jgi:hypothetical protein
VTKIIFNSKGDADCQVHYAYMREFLAGFISEKEATTLKSGKPV